MVKVDEQRAWTDVTERNHKIDKIQLKRGHLQCLHVSKKCLEGTIMEKSPNPFWEICVLGCLSEVHVE